MLKLQVVFQGGGAKLVTLMAAAEILEELQSRNVIKVTRVVGTSAGGIVACMLSSRKKISEYRELVKESGPEAIASLGKIPWKPILYKRIIGGKPLMSENVIRSFFRDIFTKGITNVEYLRDLQTNTILITSNIRYGEQNCIDSSIHKNIRVEDALCDTCALPFIFRTFSNSEQTVDGGICSNLAADELFSRGQKVDEHILGFGFESEEYETPSNVVSYAKSLMFTSIDSSVVNNMERIRLGGGEIVKLRSQYRTLDFNEALKDGLAVTNFEETKKTIMPKIEKALKKLDKKNRINEQPDALREKVNNVHNRLCGDFPVKMISGSTFVIANSLRERALDSRYSGYDTVIQENIYEARGDFFQALRVGIASADTAPFSGESDWHVEDMDGNEIRATQVIYVEEKNFEEGAHQFYHALFFLEEAFPKSEGQLRVTQRSDQRATEGLSKYGTDWMRNLCVGERLYEEFVVACPVNIGKILMSDLCENIDKIPDEIKPKDLDRMRNDCAVGRAMDASELRKYEMQYRFSSPNCSLFGWRVENPKVGDYCGVLMEAGNKS